MEETLENTTAGPGEDVTNCDALIPTNLEVQSLVNGTNEVKNTIVGATDTDKENTASTSGDNDGYGNTQRNITFEGFPYIVDHVGKTYVGWRCQRLGLQSKQCQALVKISNYPSKRIHRCFDHDCVMTRNWTTVTVVYKHYPENWMVVPNDLTNIVIYTHEAGHKLIYYNKAKYSNKLDSEDRFLFKCTTLPTCKAKLKLRNTDTLAETNKLMLIECGEHNCNVLQEERRNLRHKRMLEIRKCETQFVYVKVINYLDNYDQDLKTLLQLKVVPELDPNDSTTIVRYRNEHNNKMVYYKGYEYILKKMKHICYKSAQCKAKLIVGLIRSKVLEFGKHTCNGNNTTLIKSEVADEIFTKDTYVPQKPDATIVSLTTCSELSSDKKSAVDEVETPYENKYDLNSKDEDTVAVKNSSTPKVIGFEDGGDEIEGNTTDDEDTAFVNYLTDDLSSQPVKYKDYVITRGKNGSYVPKLNPTDSSTLTVYMDKGNRVRLQKLMHYKGYTYVDAGQKTNLYLCKSLKCSGALNLNVLRGRVCEVGTHNCTINYDPVTKNSRRNLNKSKPKIASSLKSQTPKNAKANPNPLDRRSSLENETSKISKATPNSDKNNSQELTERVCSPEQSVAKFFKYGGKKYAYYQNHIYVDKGTSFHSYPVLMCKKAPCLAAIKRYPNKEGFVSMGSHSCSVTSHQHNINRIRQGCNDSDNNNLDEDIRNIDTKMNIVEIEEMKIKPEIRIKEETDDININEVNSPKQDYFTGKTDLMDSLSNSICNETQSSHIYFENLPIHDTDGQERMSLSLAPNNDNFSSENDVSIAPNRLGQPYVEAIPDARLTVRLNADLAAPNILGQPYATGNSVAQSSREEKISSTISERNLIETLEEREKNVAPDMVFRNVKVKSFVEKKISYDSLKELEKVLKLDSDNFQEYEVAVFRDKKNRKLFYYKGHTYLADAKALAMCSNHPCSAALKVCYCDKVVVEVAVLGIHDCYLTDAEIALNNSVKRIFGKSEAMATATSTTNIEPPLEHKGVPSGSSKSKTREDLLLNRRALKDNKSVYESLIKKATKFKNIKIINYLLTKFVKVTLEEQTRFSMAYDKNEAFIIFRGYSHQKIRIDANSSQNIISYICTKFNELCDGSLLMANNKVIEFRDHFCKGIERVDYAPVYNNGLRIYYNAANACPELSYKGFTYWNVHWNKWKVPDGSYWICSQAKCYVHLKIIDDMVGQLGQHKCIFPHSAGNINITGHKPSLISPPRVGTKNISGRTAENFLISVKDEKDNSCMIYNGYVCRLMEPRESSKSSWVCINKQWNDCTGSLRINKGTVTAVSKHYCCEQDSINKDLKAQEIKSNLAAKHLLNLCDTETSELLQQDRTLHYITETQVNDLMYLYAPRPSKHKKIPKYVYYRGYIYRFVSLSTQGFQRGECIYGGSNSSCRGILTCKKYMPVTVSNHSCREERGGKIGNKNSEAEITINEDGIQYDVEFTQQTENEIVDINETLTPLDEEQHLLFAKEETEITDNIDIKEEGLQEMLVHENVDYYMPFEIQNALRFDKAACDTQKAGLNISAENEKNVSYAPQLLDSVKVSAGHRKRKATAKTNLISKVKRSRRQEIGDFYRDRTQNVAYTEEIHLGENVNLEGSDTRPNNDDIEATLPCTIIRSLSTLCGNVSNDVIEISDDEA